jgi:hypothetical protein
MAFITLFEDTFHRADENPLSDSNNWATQPNFANPLQVLSDVCAPTARFQNFETYTGSLPNDQFAQVTLGSFVLANAPFYRIDVRLTTPSGILHAYFLTIYTDSGGNQMSFTLTVDSTLIWSFSTGVPAVAGDVVMLAAQGTTLSVYRNGVLQGSVSDATYSSGTVGLQLEALTATTDIVVTDFQAGEVVSVYSISGNAGIPSALISYTGTSSGSVFADGSGNYTISGLANGPYTITPSKVGYTFSPTSASETVSNANITGVNFTATLTSYWSQPDCRLVPNASRSVNLTLTFDVQTSSNASVPGTDSRAGGAPVESSTPPTNSRTPGVFGPGE